MKKRFPEGLVLLFMLACQLVWAEAPAGYYDGISGLKDRQLKTKLHEIIRNHGTNSYNGLFKQSFCHTDVRSDGTWWDMYSDITRYVRNGWSGMNREHCFPKSWWGGDQSIPPYTDLNHLYPSDGDANMAKSNYPLGEVADATFDNGVVKVGSPVRGQGGGTTRVFEPADEYKGDFARTYFYMVTCYQNLTWKYTYMAQNGPYPSLQGWAIDLLLKWHRADPVSDKERNRNDEVYRLQYNRNPFIDYPDLAEYVWGRLKGEEFVDEDLPPVGDGTLIAPANGSTLDFGDVVAGETKSLMLPFRGSLSSDLSITLVGEDRSDFSIPVGSISWKEINSDGYELKITYKPSAVGEDNARLLLFDGGLTVSSFAVNLKGTAREMPVFDRPEATEATDVSSAGFTANWQTPQRPEEVDFYVVNVSEYAGGGVSKVSVSTDGAETSLRYSDVKSGASYAYTVQSSRYGVLSPESNVVRVDVMGSVESLDAASPLAVEPIPGGVRFRCETVHTGVSVFDMSGRQVSRLEEVADGTCMLLPYGAFLVVSDQCRQPVKVLVR